MVFAIVGAVARVVEELRAQALIEGPVCLQLLFVAHEQVVVVAPNVGLAEALRPQAELIDRPFKVSQLKLRRICK